MTDDGSAATSTSPERGGQVRDEVTRSLMSEFQPQYSEETVRAVVDRTWRRLSEHARYTTFVPLLARRYASDELRGQGRFREH